MARVTKEMPFSVKVELGVAAIGVLTAMAELIHGYPYLMGLKDPENYQPLFVQVAIGTLGESLRPVSHTVVPVTREGTPLFTGVLPPGTGVTETGEVIMVTPTPTPNLTLSTPRPDADPQEPLLTELASDRATPEQPTAVPPTATERPTAVAAPPTAIIAPPEPIATENLAPPNLPTPQGLPRPEGWSPPPGWPEDTVYRGGDSFRLYRWISPGSTDNPMPGFENPGFTHVEDCRTDNYCPGVSDADLTVSQAISLARQIGGENARIRVIYIGDPNGSKYNPYHVVGIAVQILNN